MSPYEEKYVDVKYIGDLLGSSTITVEEVSQQSRLWFLAVGFILLLLAPSISSWVHFYYSTSMVIGVFMVIIFLLFQMSPRSRSYATGISNVAEPNSWNMYSSLNKSHRALPSTSRNDMALRLQWLSSCQSS